MVTKKDLVIAVLTTFCLTSTLFMIERAISSGSQYDPWKDVNDDGSINIIDISMVAKLFGTTGTPINKTQMLDLAAIEARVAALETRAQVLESKTAALEGKTGLPPPDYDSNWFSVDPGTYMRIPHNLHQIDDLFVYMTGRRFVTGYEEIHQRTSLDGGNAICWYAPDPDSIIVWRDPNDLRYNEIRVRIWKIQPAT